MKDMADRARRKDVPPPRRILLVAAPPVDELDFVGPAQVFAIANRMAGRTAYEVEVATSGPGLEIAGEGGLLSFVAHKTIAEARGPYDSVLLACGLANRHQDDPALSAWLQARAEDSRRLGAVCVAAFLLARAGLLDDRRATSHWRFVEEFAARYPRVNVTAAPIWIQDGRIFTSAGVAAGFDLTLGWVESDLGAALAAEVAKELVLFARRTGSQAQISELLAAQSGERRRMRELVVWISENLPRPLTVDALAEQAGMSRRTLERSFAREIGRSPLQFVLLARINAARRLLETTSRSLDQVAFAAGFGSADAMRRAFRRAGAGPPRAFRESGLMLRQ
jgi:transcriptional regulator GlxA family with amidase domain